MHKCNFKDVEAAFTAYQLATGDAKARLCREDSATWFVVSDRTRCLEAIGARNMCAILGAYVVGWQGAADAVENAVS